VIGPKNLHIIDMGSYNKMFRMAIVATHWGEVESSTLRVPSESAVHSDKAGYSPVGDVTEISNLWSSTPADGADAVKNFGSISEIRDF
jgi:hypothetical protein